MRGIAALLERPLGSCNAIRAASKFGVDAEARRDWVAGTPEITWTSRCGQFVRTASIPRASTLGVTGLGKTVCNEHK